jgi:hypothetical protein
MSSPFEKKFCGKSPLKELTAKQEANLPEALKTAIEAKSPTNYGSPLEQQDDKSYFDSITKLPGVKDRYKKYVKRKEEGYTDPEDGYIAPSPGTIVTPERHAVSIEIGKGGKSGVKGAKASRSDLYKMKYKDFVKK